MGPASHTPSNTTLYLVLVGKRGVPPKSDLVESLSGPDVLSPSIDEIGTRPVRLDGPPI